jgi:hypothetical protein
MKSTAERLSESYCRPRTVEERKALLDAARNVSRFVFDENPTWPEFSKSANGNAYGFTYSEADNDRTEIPVSHFIDLLNDAIDAPWRLLDDGFNVSAKEGYYTGHSSSLVFVDRRGVVWLNNRKLNNVTTYTDLLTLIRLIG